MCGIINSILPIVGGIIGGIVGGPWGAAAGAALGGFGGTYASTHNFGGSLLAGGLSGLMSGIGNGLGAAGAGLGSAGGTAAGDVGASVFTTGLEGAAGQTTLGGLEGSLGGAGLLGVNAGTGTVIGDAATNLGAGGLGIAGGAQSLGDVLGANTMYAQGLGGGSAGGQGTGINAASGNSGAMLNPAQQSLAGGALPAEGSQQLAPNTMGIMSNSGVTPQAQAGGTFSLEGSQGVPIDPNAALAGAVGQQPDTQGLSSLYGPTSTAPQSPMGSAMSADYNSVTPSAFGNQGSFTSIPGTGSTKMGDDFQWNSPQGLGTLFRLGNTGLGMYQQYRQGQLARDYANSINQMFAPNSPYAQQMQQELARKDAAAGRNSQYGSRAVQLAAALTQGKANALAGNNYATAAQNNSGASMLNGLFANFGSPQAMQGLYGAGQSAYNGLAGLFGY